MQTACIQIKPDALSGLIWIQTDCKGYKQTTKFATGSQRVKQKIVADTIRVELLNFMEIC